MLVMLITNVLIGLCVWGVFAAWGLDNAGLWGIVAGVLHVLPYAGTALITVAAGVAALVQLGSLVGAALVAAATFGVILLIGTGLNTWLSSRFSRINPVIVFAGLLFFGWLWGVWGLLLALPLLAVAKAVSERIEELQPIAEFMADSSPARR
jgi:predicted PurR-regulated permease PerM